MKYISIVYSEKIIAIIIIIIKNEQTAKKDMINSFFFNYNSRIIQEYFQAKIGRKIRIFSLARKKQHFYMKKECIIKMGRFYPNGDHYSM